MGIRSPFRDRCRILLKNIVDYFITSDIMNLVANSCENFLDETDKSIHGISPTFSQRLQLNVGRSWEMHYRRSVP